MKHFPAPPLIFLSFHFPEKHNTVPVTKLVVRVEEVVALVTGEAVLEHDLYRHVEVSLRPLLPPLSLLSPETRQRKNRSSSVKRLRNLLPIATPALPQRQLVLILHVDLVNLYSKLGINLNIYLNV